MSTSSDSAEYYVGLISGTSIDAVDAALVAFDDERIHLAARHTHPLPDELRARLLALLNPGDNELEQLAALDGHLGRLFAEATSALLHKAGIAPGQVRAIGSHGQTVRHLPHLRTTVQIGDPNVIAELTGICTVADFRRRDMAAGGQGAPLVPAFHAAVFSHASIDRAVVNIGGIANITALPHGGEAPVLGLDTGPGNGLMDAWAAKQRGTPMDHNGEWAASGSCDPRLLDALLRDPYFEREAPKSTGREYFGLPWLEQRLARFAKLAPADVQATLCELTAKTIAQGIARYAPATREVLLCGGGVHNTHLVGRLTAQLEGRRVASTAAWGIEPDWVEAMAFAWLARRRLRAEPGNMPSVTGARRPVVLGAVYPGTLPEREG